MADLPHIGIACSGRGVRSAAFSSGMLEELLARKENDPDDKIIDDGTHIKLSCVSGGGYLGSSFVNHLLGSTQNQNRYEVAVLVSQTMKDYPGYICGASYSQKTTRLKFLFGWLASSFWLLVALLGWFLLAIVVRVFPYGCLIAILIDSTIGNDLRNGVLTSKENIGHAITATGGALLVLVIVNKVLLLSKATRAAHVFRILSFYVGLLFSLAIQFELYSVTNKDDGKKATEAATPAAAVDVSTSSSNPSDSNTVNAGYSVILFVVLSLIRAVAHGHVKNFFTFTLASWGYGLIAAWKVGVNFLPLTNSYVEPLRKFEFLFITERTSNTQAKIFIVACLFGWVMLSFNWASGYLLDRWWSLYYECRLCGAFYKAGSRNTRFSDLDIDSQDRPNTKKVTYICNTTLTLFENQQLRSTSATIQRDGLRILCPADNGSEYTKIEQWQANSLHLAAGMTISAAAAATDLGKHTSYDMYANAIGFLSASLGRWIVVSDDDKWRVVWLSIWSISIIGLGSAMIACLVHSLYYQFMVLAWTILSILIVAPLISVIKECRPHMLHLPYIQNLHLMLGLRFEHDEFTGTHSALSLSDGGHYENLGVLPLFSDPHVGNIYIADGSEDPQEECKDLFWALDFARTHFNLSFYFEGQSEKDFNYNFLQTFVHGGPERQRSITFKYHRNNPLPRAAAAAAAVPAAVAAASAAAATVAAAPGSSDDLNFVPPRPQLRWRLPLMPLLLRCKTLTVMLMLSVLQRPPLLPLPLLLLTRMKFPPISSKP
eukprot:TRINITY_DN8724_c3_g1_i1.p1 TRINITY_DN8724_c3_g1~~TRINITY_DN8724_c3_g1_i1.p1  ORF type:complete len:811 (-),score=51.59 TRINITY_DN8724_c3_g1_i1:592-2907(-)